MKWDPAQYNRFSAERNQPFFDLTSRIGASSPQHVVDLGCGPGDLTATLSQRWPNARVVGLDSSAEMIERAHHLQLERIQTFPTLDFELADVADWQPSADVDVIVSNALLQWIPNHQALIEQWAAKLQKNAWLAFQVPGNFQADSHRLMAELAESPGWDGRLHGVLRHHRPVSEPADYLTLLMDHGFAAQAWETTYLHVLPGPDPVLEWVRGTGLRPVLAALSPSDAQMFEDEYAAMLRIAYPDTPHGTVFPFRRIFCVGTKL